MGTIKSSPVPEMSGKISPRGPSQLISKRGFSLSGDSKIKNKVKLRLKPL